MGTCNGILRCSEQTPAIGNLDESHKHNVEWKEPGKKEWRLSSQRSSSIKGTKDSTTVESSTSSLGQKLILGRPKHQVWPIGHGWWGVNVDSPFPRSDHKGPSRGGFPKEQRKSSKAQKLISYQEYLPTQRMDPRLWKTNLTTFSADTLPLSTGGPLSLLPSRCPQTSCVRLRLSIQAGRRPLWPNGHIFPCGPVTTTVRLFHLPLFQWNPPPSATAPIGGPGLGFITGLQCVLLFLIRLPETCLQDPNFFPVTCLLGLLPLTKLAIKTGNLFGALSCPCVHPVPSTTLHSWEPWSSFLSFFSSSCLC